MATDIADKQSTSQPRDIAADSQHSYFTGILESVQATLKQRFSQSARSKKEPPRHTTSEAKQSDDFVNKFFGLNVEEPSEPDYCKNEPKPNDFEELFEKQEVSYKAESIADYQEACLAFCCHLRDFCEMRLAVKGSWIAFGIDRCDLISAALTTNIAFELARRLEEDMDCFAAYGGSEQFVKDLQGVMRLQRHLIPHFADLDDEDFKYAIYDSDLNAAYWLPYQVLRLSVDSVRKAIPEGAVLRGLPQSRLESLIEALPCGEAALNTALDRSELNGREKFQQDSSVLGAIISDPTLAIATQPDDVSTDEFQRGLEEAIATGRIPLWLAFAGQMLIDINYLLRDKVDLASHHLRHISAAIQHSTIDQLDFQHKILKEAGPSGLASELANLLAAISAICHEDPLYDLRQQFAQDQGSPVEKHRLSKLHPLSCGLQALAIRGNFHRISLCWANSRTSILSCAVSLSESLYWCCWTWSFWSSLIHHFEANGILASA